MRQIHAHIINYYNIQYTVLNHHFMSSPGDFPPGESSAHYPGRFFLGNSSPGTLPRETCPINPPPGTRKSPESPPEASGNPLRHSSLLLFNGPLTSLVPRKGGYPQHSVRIDDRPDLSDVGWTSH